ncbi:hypothetical protein BJ684DRAFT_18657 [Piptocephalis cylindrospora]|uniref:Uncharacterized protein n=1 Tax=Piptocephalis cylindrospora TaxID=1907219 RepID=A0A4P9Y7G0_9FUNG|nr:hypothetical protein BJ684DRAFT_18657 [Piptocephalis cylindrospora]|eukprot:RKP14973.1 hypothetical protein BJ684DRAFT_18657 [Piptocephalis cylindrospora]
MDTPVSALPLLLSQPHHHTQHQQYPHVVPPAAWGGYLRPEDGISPEQNRLILLVALPLNLLSMSAALSVFLAILYLRRHYPRLADRVSLRLTLATAFVDALYHLFQMISDLAEPREGNFWCTFSVWGYVWASLLSVFLTAALALNLQLVWFHKILLPVSFERLYYSLALAASLFASVPPWLFGAYGPDEVEGTCWFRDLGSHTALFWQWTSLFGWLCLSILYCSVALALVSWKLWDEHNGDDDYDDDEDDGEDSLPGDQEELSRTMTSSYSSSGGDDPLALWERVSRRFSRTIHPRPLALAQRGGSGGKLELGRPKEEGDSSGRPSPSAASPPAHPNHLGTHPPSRPRARSASVGHWTGTSGLRVAPPGSLGGIERSLGPDQPQVPPILESPDSSTTPKSVTSSSSSSSSSSTLLTPTSGPGTSGQSGAYFSGRSGNPQNRYSTASTLYSSSATLCPSSSASTILPSTAAPAYRIRADRAAARAARRRQRKIRRQIHAAVARIALYPIIPILTQSLNVISVMDAYATSRVSFPLYFASFCATGSQGLLNAIVFLCDPAIHNSWRVVREDALAHARSQRVLGRETLASRLTLLLLRPSREDPSFDQIMEPHFPLYRSQLNASMERNISSSSTSSVCSSGSSLSMFFEGTSDPIGEPGHSLPLSSHTDSKSASPTAITPPATALTRCPAPALPYTSTILDRVDEEAELAVSDRTPSASLSSPPCSTNNTTTSIPSSPTTTTTTTAPTCSTTLGRTDGNGYARHIRFL